MRIRKVIKLQSNGRGREVDHDFTQDKKKQIVFNNRKTRKGAQMAVMEFLLSEKILANCSPFAIKNQKILQISDLSCQLKLHRLLVDS